MEDWTTSEHAVGVVAFLLEYATHIGVAGLFILTVLYAFKSWKQRPR